MQPRRAFHRALCAACWCACFAPAASRAADKTSLACIQGAEQGQAARDAGDLLRARGLFAQCAVRDCPPLLRRDCTVWLEETQRQIPSLVTGARDGAGRDVLDARASIDGVVRQTRLDATAIEVNPGPHVLRVEGPAVGVVELRIVVRPGEKNRPILVTSDAPPGPVAAVETAAAGATPAVEERRGLPARAYALGAVGVAALGAFGYFAIRGKQDADELRDTCAPGCRHAEVEAVRTKLLLADIALGVGVASLAAAVWTGLANHRAPQRAAMGWHVTSNAGRAGASVEMRF